MWSGGREKFLSIAQKAAAHAVATHEAKPIPVQMEWKGSARTQNENNPEEAATTTAIAARSALPMPTRAGCCQRAMGTK